LNVEDIEVSSAQQRAAAIFNMIPMFLALAAFTGGMSIATDSTAGERERGSLEPLLVNPVPRFELAAGKWLAAVALSAAGMTATLLIITAVLLRVPIEDLGIRSRFGAPDAMLLMVVALPLALIAPSIQMYLASFARSFKEAQSYMGYLIFIPMLPGMASAFYPLAGRPWLAPVPIIGQYALATDIIGGKPPSPFYFVVAALCTAGFALLFLSMTTRLFSKEKIIFGR
jgi:sodium transport system permease protein